jgi:hypothetical protein
VPQVPEGASVLRVPEAISIAANRDGRFAPTSRAGSRTAFVPFVSFVPFDAILL